MWLIDAKSLLKEFEKRQEQQINEYCDCFLNDSQTLSTEWWCVEDAVAAAPIIDAVPVVHAMWEQRGNIILCAGEHGCYEAMPWNYYTQSKFDGKLPAYCPHCGAKMGGGAEE